MTVHYEELWEKCESLFKNESENQVSTILDELLMKINLYKLIDDKKEIPEEDRQNAKSRTLGEILLTLTNLSLKDNINVFDALGTAFKNKSINHYKNKYK